MMMMMDSNRRLEANKYLLAIRVNSSISTDKMAGIFCEILWNVGTVQHCRPTIISVDIMQVSVKVLLCVFQLLSHVTACECHAELKATYLLSPIRQNTNCGRRLILASRRHTDICRWSCHTQHCSYTDSCDDSRRHSCQVDTLPQHKSQALHVYQASAKLVNDWDI